MSEEQVSVGLFRSATQDPNLVVLSWQSVDGKGYFAADIKFRMPTGERFEPDLILSSSDAVWVIEVKGDHRHALEDELKLAALWEALGSEGIREQVGRRCRGEQIPEVVELAVAYLNDNQPSSEKCVPGVHHLDWARWHVPVAADGLGTVLSQLSRS